jgi:anhydro-N-acetylmuramic acid kinase
MSGMSMDGLDLALVHLAGRGERPRVDLRAARTVPYEEALRARLQAARGPAGEEARRLDAELASLWAGAVRAFLADAGVEPAEVWVLGSHGQTLDHHPREAGRPARTLQVGDGVRLARETGVRTVFDFRPADVEAGGEGAPLVPLAEWILHGSGEVTASHNLGSIANVTVLTPRLEDVVAFDTGPANVLVDAFARRATGDVDRDGVLSAAGHVDDDALLVLYVKRAAWLAQAPPKSAGYGTFGPDLVAAVRAACPRAAPADLVRTAVEFTARTIHEAYDRFVRPRFPGLARVRFSGGGTRNPTLMAAIRARLEPELEVEVVAGAPGDAQEAVAFALLADRTVRGLPGNVPGATGASRPVVLGRVAEP